MKKFHIGRNGLPAPCTAQGSCPLGGPGDHFDSLDEAYNEAQDRLKKEYDTIKFLGSIEGIQLASGVKLKQEVNIGLGTDEIGDYEVQAFVLNVDGTDYEFVALDYLSDEHHYVPVVMQRAGSEELNQYKEKVFNREYNKIATINDDGTSEDKLFTPVPDDWATHAMIDVARDLEQGNEGLQEIYL